jgi:predicted RNase H-like HicB family nuclease
MKRYTFTTEKTSDGYSAYCEGSDGGVIAITGDTIKELKENALDALNLTLGHHGKKTVTAENIVLAFDLQQFFEYYKEINVKQLAGRITINRTLLSQYINGTKKPSRFQTEKILNGVKALGRELADADFI